MAMTGDPIVAYPGTLTGSIGVVFGKPNLQGLYNKLGITKDAIERGRHAGIDSDYTALTPEEIELLRKGIDESYRDFVSKVAEARHRSFEQIDAVAQGRVWLGSQAKDKALIDSVGGFDTALDLLKKKAKLPAEERPGILMYPPKRSILDLIMRRSQEDVVEIKLRQVMGKAPFHAWMRGGLLRILPLAFDIR
jgi:protease-4